MAFVSMLVDKGICNSCNGSGWTLDADEVFPSERHLREKPDSFDIGKCTSCHGSGIVWEQEEITTE